MPLDEHAPVKTETIIGKHAAKPMVLDHPVYISPVSYTHLDVYKRQGNKGASLRGGLRHGIGQSFGDREANGL